MINAQIVKDSLAPNGCRLTTFVLTYPRFIHAEFMTHRVFSRNASSSRAIPVSKQIQEVKDNPAIPLAFTKNKAGMQGGDALTGEAHEAAVQTWLKARDLAATQAEEMVKLEIHKQYANRILEPWAHITVVCSATDWDNFFTLRIHPAAQPEICELARQMYESYQTNDPEPLAYGQWHLPFIEPTLVGQDILENLIKRSVAKCARVSYKNHDGTPTTLEQDLALYDRLVGAQPIHASPAEHQATPAWAHATMSGNFRGWTQYRKMLDGENVTTFKPLGETV